MVTTTLSIHNHSRDIAGYTYVYPVISRRAGGVSVGINLNPNNACNWACIYCQVPNLTRGSAPLIDVIQLEAELRDFLHQVLHGEWLRQYVPEGAQVLQDIAFSGNGEPTSAAEFPQAVELAASVLDEMKLAGSVKLRLITNGSLLDRADVRAGIAALGRAHGEVWFKLDAATPAGWLRINGTRQRPDVVLRRLLACAALCETWVQSCFFAVDGVPPDEAAIVEYVELLREAADVIAGVHLYSLARPSLQPEAPRLARLPAEWLEGLAVRIRALGPTVQVSP